MQIFPYFCAHEKYILLYIIMQIRLTPPARLRGTVGLPASKSISNRALIINALSKGTRPPQNVSDCDDTFVMVRALTQSTDIVDIMAAGTAMRFLSAYFAVTPGTRVITGTERMQHRPIGILTDALRTLGARIEYAGQEGFPPLRITGGTHRGGTLSLPGNVSSQYISALLMIGPVLPDGLRLELTGQVISRPYINLTLQLMNDFGARAQWSSENSITVEPAPYISRDYYIENDWSAASYWYQMVVLSDDEQAEIQLPGLFRTSYQGDSAVQQLFARLGVSTEFYTDGEGQEGICLRKNGACPKRLDYDFVNQPDLAQTFVVTCALLGVHFRFTGLQSLKIKETDRISALINELHKLGYAIGETDGSVLYWNGERCAADEQPAIDTYEDHRMALAFAPCCLKLGEIRINDPHVVSKSYPQYWNHLRQAGFNISEP